MTNVRKFRIKVEEISEGKHKHKFQATILAKSTKHVREKIEAAFEAEIDEARQEFIHYLASKKGSLIDELIKNLEDDLIDWKSKGQDVSKEEFLRNEIEFERLKYG